MGIYDRDYQRSYYDEQQPGFHLGASTLTTRLVIAMFGIYLVQLLTEPSQPAFGNDDGWFTNTFRLYADVFRRPWMAFEFLTYGFLHDADYITHILLNMLTFWIFGRAVEERYGSREFLLFFVAAIVCAGLVLVVGEWIANSQLRPIPMLGASGGVTAIVILFAMNFPHQTVLFNFLLPMPMWVLAVIMVAMDVIGTMNRTEDSVAFTAHLGGAAFGYLYYRNRLRLERWLPGRVALPRLKRKPQLRVIGPEAEDNSTDSRVDEILRKIKEHGQDSLTWRERRILQQASREYQKRRGE